MINKILSNIFTFNTLDLNFNYFYRSNPDFLSHGDDDRTDRERGQILILDRYVHNRPIFSILQSAFSLYLTRKTEYSISIDNVSYVCVRVCFDRVPSRTFDTVTPLMHEYTYQAMVMDLLEVRTFTRTHACTYAYFYGLYCACNFYLLFFSCMNMN